MKDKEFKKYLLQSTEQKIRTERMEETIKSCIEIMREQKVFREEPRTGFWGYLSDVFRFEGMSILGLQAVTLVIVCLTISTMSDIAMYLPAFMPLFILAVLPTFFKSLFYKMSEIEAVTRASTAQIMLAKLILSGAANLMCITVLLGLEVYLQGSCDELGQMILYCLVPYLVYMAALLRLFRLRKRESLAIYAIAVFSSCLCWGMSAKFLPWLYEASAIGLWIVVFVVFAVFFVKEVCYIVEMRKEGKMYGIVA